MGCSPVGHVVKILSRLSEHRLLLDVNPEILIKLKFKRLDSIQKENLFSIIEKFFG